MHSIKFCNLKIYKNMREKRQLYRIPTNKYGRNKETESHLLVIFVVGQINRWILKAVNKSLRRILSLFLALSKNSLAQEQPYHRNRRQGLLAPIRFWFPTSPQKYSNKLITSFLENQGSPPSLVTTGNLPQPCLFILFRSMTPLRLDLASSILFPQAVSEQYWEAAVGSTCPVSGVYVQQPPPDPYGRNHSITIRTKERK